MKKRFLNLALIGAAVILSAGCAGQKSYTETFFQPPPIPAGDGRVYFFRGGEFKGSGVNTKISVNDESVGVISSDCFFYVDKPPGDYFIRCRTGLMDPNQGEHKLTFTLAAGENKYIRIQEHFGFVTANAVPVLEEKDSAMKTMADCRYTPQGK